MTIKSFVATRSRPLRRRLTPLQFKETYINRALAGRDNALYVEIGVRSGESMRNVRARSKVGVDPMRMPAMERLLDGEQFYQMTSDVFFADEADRAFGDQVVDVALIDGYHEFQQTLRDILNIEPYMASDGLIVIDDCNPQSAAAAVDVPTGGVWNGDVWKVAEFFTRERPDLSYITVDADQGVGLLWGFGQPTDWPEATTLARYKHLDYGYLESAREEILRLVGPRQFRRDFSENFGYRQT